MKSRFPEPKKYKHQQFMNDLNDMMVRVKAHLYGTIELKNKYKTPEYEELDELQRKIVEVLEKDNEPMRKFSEGHPYDLSFHAKKNKNKKKI